MTEQTPTPAQPTPAQPTPAQPTPAQPTPATMRQDVPLERWTAALEAAAQAPATERHSHFSTLLDDLDAQVSSL